MTASASVQLLVGEDADADLLAGALDESYAVSRTPPDEAAFLDAEFDICLVDAAAFRSHRDLIARRRERAEPVFLPVLLVLGEDEPSRAGDDVWAVVDEVIDAPIRRAELRHRVENLLERRRLSVSLRRRQRVSEERFRTLFESTPDPIVVVTTEGVVTEVNDAFLGLFDVDAEAVVGEHVSEVPTAPSDTIERLLLRVEGDGDTVEFETAAGETCVTEVNVDAVSELGDATERIGIFRDVSAREERERELERQIRQLERFASIISHDLRDPLNTAQAKVRLAREECDSDYLDELDAVHDRMARLVDDVLELARQGRAIGETEPVSLAAVADAAWRTIDADDATLRADDLPTVEADRERLRALLENLFKNAVEHGGEGVTVRVGATEEGFFVADDGPGVPASEREVVFDYGHTGTPDGTGLGLAIVAEIAEAHGWTVSVGESESGGARFDVAR